MHLKDLIEFFKKIARFASYRLSDSEGRNFKKTNG